MKKIIENIMRLLPLKYKKSDPVPFSVLFGRFQDILKINNKVLESIADVNDKLGGNYIFDRHYIETISQNISDMVLKLIDNLDAIAPRKYMALHESYRRILVEIEMDLAGRSYCQYGTFIMPYKEIGHDASELVGGKNASLAELQNFLDIKIPDGFAVTATAFKAFLEKNDLQQEIATIIGEWKSEKRSLEDAASYLQHLILSSPLPNKLEKELAHSLTHLSGNYKNKDLFFAVRSSAWGEDGERSFAGQYKSILNVPASNLADAYRQVVASAYSESALMYRRQIGFQEDEVVMAVGCQIMVDADASGVLYTLDPSQGYGGTMKLSATWGLGAPVVSGQAIGDQFSIDRTPPNHVKGMQLVRKETALQSQTKGGTILKQVGTNLQTQTCLHNDQLSQLAQTGILIENYFKKPQDIEFAINKEGDIIVLQSRPLNIKAAHAPKAPDLAKLLSQYPVLFSDKGEIAQEGVATGQVYLVSEDARLRDVPAGAILVARFASPQLAKVMAKVSAIITDVGSTTGHLATIAREFRVPCILNTGNVTEILHDGQDITVDAEANIVYEGLVNELCFYELNEEAIEETSEYKLLRRVQKNIAPLNLLDPAEKSFTPTACRTLHDITRFVHEKAVEELIDRNFYQRHAPHNAAGKLQWDIPLDLVLIDIGGGLQQERTKGDLKQDAILSLPMQALLDGIAHPRAWDNEPMSVDMKSFMSSLTKTFSTELASPKYVGQNLAVISKEYANVSLRLGYHFTMIDSYVTDNINDNYAYFRFFGGVTDQTRRSRRAKFLGTVLSRHDFRVELHNDLVVARIKKLDKKGMLQRLNLLGQLVGFTRQLDVKMLSENHINQQIDKFNRLMEVNI